MKGAGHLFLRSALFEPILFQNIDMLQLAQMEFPGLLDSEEYILSFETIFSINTFGLVQKKVSAQNLFEN